MRILALHPNFTKPITNSEISGIYDLFMPDQGVAVPNLVKTVELGFAAELPEGTVGLVRVSPVAAARGLELPSGMAFFGPGSTEPWTVKLRTKSQPLNWDADAQLLQLLLVSVHTTHIEEVLDF